MKAQFLLKLMANIWPAAGLVDTEIGYFHLSEVRNATKEVQARAFQHKAESILDSQIR